MTPLWIGCAFSLGAGLARFADWLAARISKRHRWACDCFDRRGTRIVDSGRPGNCNCFMICGHEPQSTPLCFHYGKPYKLDADGRFTP